jgi:anti-anti-sigma factor
MIGVALSILWLVYVSATPATPTLGRQPGTQVFRSLDEYPDGETHPGLTVLRFDAGLFFASSDALTDRLRSLTADPDDQPDVIVVSFEGVPFIDSQGSSQISSVVDAADRHGIEVRLARVKPEVLDVLEADGVVERLGADHVYGNVYEAAADHIDDS